MMKEVILVLIVIILADAIFPQVHVIINTAMNRILYSANHFSLLIVLVIIAVIAMKVLGK